MMRGFSTVAKAATLAALMVVVGCSSNDSTRIVQPDDSDDSNAAPEMAMAPESPSHRGITGGDLLRWSEPLNADAAGVIGYNVYARDSQSGGVYERVNPVLLLASRIFTDTFEEGETIRFRVAAVNAYGDEGAWSESVSFVAHGPGGGHPGLPQQEAF